MNDMELALNERFKLQEEYLGKEKEVNKLTPLVSITVATYQHVHYIKQCLDGILMQQTNFPYEIILGEDGSVDGTQQICKEYAKKFPDKIRLFIRDRKLSQYTDVKGELSRFNGVWNRMSSRGKYIAWCEGDDYWIDPLKLQKQVDFMEEHHEYSMCFHNAVILHQGKNLSVSLFNNLNADKDLSIEDCVCNWLVPTASMLLRNEIVKKQSNWLCRIYSGDYSMILTMFHNGKIRYINQLMSVYRVDYTGSSASASMKNRAVFILSQKLILLNDFNEKTNFSYADVVNKQIYYFKNELKVQLIKDKQGFFRFLSIDVFILIMRKILNRFFIL